jgi:hypothetical protein
LVSPVSSVTVQLWELSGETEQTAVMVGEPQANAVPAMGMRNANSANAATSAVIRRRSMISFRAYQLDLTVIGGLVGTPTNTPDKTVRC